MADAASEGPDLLIELEAVPPRFIMKTGGIAGLIVVVVTDLAARVV